MPDPTPQNLARLDALLVELGGRVEVGGQLLESSRIDVLQGLPQVPPFSALDERASEVDLDGLTVKVCSLDDLPAMKRASGPATGRETAMTSKPWKRVETKAISRPRPRRRLGLEVRR